MGTWLLEGQAELVWGTSLELFIKSHVVWKWCVVWGGEGGQHTHTFRAGCPEPASQDQWWQKRRSLLQSLPFMNSGGKGF